jgi:site-specific DNA-methyltransferase (adenine-specific)
MHGNDPRIKKSDWQVIQGDCLEVMAGMEAGSVDAVVTDPPYCSGARTSAGMTNRGSMGNRGEKWKAKPLENDQMTVTGFTWLMRQMGRESLRLLKPGGWFLSFIDWRQYPTLYAAIETVNLRVAGLVVWDKKHFALGNGFRNQHELVLVASRGVGNAHDKGVPNVLSVPRISASELHPTEKPVGIYRQLLKVVAPSGDGLVLDPFAGSGSCGVACVETGRNFIGIELNPEYCEIARRRIDEASRQGRLF